VRRFGQCGDRNRLPADALAELPQPYVGWQGALCALISEG
jgi:hypothetical protein